ncbi:MAG: hypothetical protein AB7S26_34240 [Sandaracinaceae bacterium]
MGGRGAVLLAAALALLAPRPAAAQERLAFAWTAPPECPTRERVLDEIARLLGGEIPDGDPLIVEGAARADPAGFALTLRTRAQGEDGAALDGTRELDGASCDELSDAAALVVALMIDPQRVAEASAVSEEPAEVESDADVEGLVEPPPLEDAERSRAAELDSPSERARAEPYRSARPAASDDRLRALVGVAGGLDVGTVPGPAGWLAIEGGLGVPLIDARLRIGVVLPQTAQRASEGARITSVSADLRACVHPFEEVRGLMACGGAIVGVSIAEGFGFTRSETGVGTFAGGLVSLGAELTLADWLGVGIDAMLIIPANPLRYATRDAMETILYSQEPVSGRFSLTADAHF